MSTVRKQQRRQRGDLERRDILSAALELMDAEGIEGSSMRRLADRLGCGTMTLYSHIGGREDLQAGVVGVMIEEMDLHHERSESWQHAMRRILHRYKGIASRHPKAFELLALSPDDRQPVAPFFERVLHILERTGLSRQKAEYLLSVSDAYATGFLLVRTQRLKRDEVAGSHDYAETGWSYLARLKSDEAFERGINIVFAGVEQMLEESEGTSESPQAFSDRQDASPHETG